MRKNQYIYRENVKGVYVRPEAEEVFLADGFPLLAGSGDESNTASGNVYDDESGIIVPGGEFGYGGETGEDPENPVEAD